MYEGSTRCSCGKHIYWKSHCTAQQRNFNPRYMSNTGIATWIPVSAVVMWFGDISTGNTQCWWIQSVFRGQDQLHCSPPPLFLDGTQLPGPGAHWWVASPICTHSFFYVNANFVTAREQMCCKEALWGCYSISRPTPGCHVPFNEETFLELGWMLGR